MKYAKKIILIFLMCSCSVAFAEEKFGVLNQEPVSSSLELVDLKTRLVDLPFDIKYPGMWYVREEHQKLGGNNVQAPSVFISREPVRKMSDIFKVGITICNYQNFFVSVASPDTEIGRMGKHVFMVREWEEAKKSFVESYKDMPGSNIIFSEEIDFSGYPAMRIVLHNGDIEVENINIKFGVDLYLIVCEMALAEKDRYKEVFDKVVRSIVFKKDVSPRELPEALRVPDGNK